MFCPRFCAVTLLNLLSLASLAEASSPTPIYINQVPAYSALAECAEVPLSQIVRNMKDGCGDGSRTTSFDCFCSTSSAYFASLIETRVANACSEESEAGQNANAVDVFGKYCQLSILKNSSQPAGAASGTTSTMMLSSTASPPSSSPQSASASLAASPTTPSVTPPPSALPGGAVSDSKEEKTKKETPVVAIAVGVVVPAVLISLGILAFALYRRCSPSLEVPEKPESDTPELSTDGQIIEADG